MGLKLLLVAAFISLTGCQAMIYGTASSFDNLKVGMTKAQVIAAIGSPTTTSADGDKHEEYLVYKKMTHAISEWPDLYRVTLRDGHVVKWGRFRAHDTDEIEIFQHQSD